MKELISISKIVLLSALFWGAVYWLVNYGGLNV